MNPLVAQQLKELDTRLEELRKELAHARQQYDAMSAARDESQKKLWSQSRELHLLRERMDQVGDIQEENARYKALTQDFEHRLRDVLKYTQALAAQLRQ